jgi:arylsulfatase
MRDHYDRWWAEIEPTVNEFSAISLGSDKANPAMLSPADWADSFLDQSAQVREGVHVNGYWNVDVERAGDYEITLRRWPVESGLALDADDPAPVRRDAVNPSPGESVALVPSKALPIARARVKVGDLDQALDVQPTDQAAVFNLSLPAGRTQLQTWFYGPKGGELCGAYYVYVRRK